MTNVGGQMRTWVFYGFLLYTAAPLYFVLLRFVVLRPPDKDGKTFADQEFGIIHILLIAFILFQAFMGLYVPIWGWFVRFDEAGKICSGDYYEGHDAEENVKPYMWETGNWMWWYVSLWMTCIFLLVTLCCCGIVLAFSVRNDPNRARA